MGGVARNPTDPQELIGCSRRPNEVSPFRDRPADPLLRKGGRVTEGVLDSLPEDGTVTADEAKQVEKALSGIHQVEATPGRLRQVKRVATKDTPIGLALDIERSTARES